MSVLSGSQQPGSPTGADQDLAQASGFGVFLFAFLEEVAASRDRILGPAQSLGATRDSDIQLLFEIARANVDGHQPTQKELAVGFQWSRKTLSNDLDRLESAGLVVRAKGDDDRRVKRTTLTAAGRDLVLAVYESAKGELPGRQGRHRGF